VADGVTIRPVTAPRPIGSLFGLAGTQNPFSATPTFRSIAHLPLAELAARMAEPEVRERILSEDPYGDSRFPLWGRLGYDKMYERMFVLTDPPQYEPDRESSIASIARREGRKPTDVAYDVLIADGGTNFLFGTFGNFDGFNLDPTREMLSYPHVLPGLGDGGAHVGYITDASFPTYLLMWWGRDRAEGRMPLEDLVRRQTGDAAGSLGLDDRGVLRAGMKADVNVIDFAQLGLAKPYVVHDLPAGGRRLLQKATGYDATIVSGVITYRHGEATGELPGRLVRGIAKPKKEPTP
jgi:N-acyl-D-aspartate/D-glutamate deacylase